MKPSSAFIELLSGGKVRGGEMSRYHQGRKITMKKKAIHED